ncbi:hypothetical protein M413DRAFT_30211 [Hebeloma cylindrosporum]|uniref:Uncharacterized protein n=1 Tax=Hebeloma cylindrosporum TaxID=76867 RepID=A0A0C3C265_HEBCY|nr:hypothetical protein M413DRAFT_30211 [Hebeloma cylindrosporum h7]
MLDVIIKIQKTIGDGTPAGFKTRKEILLQHSIFNRMQSQVFTATAKTLDDFERELAKVLREKLANGYFGRVNLLPQGAHPVALSSVPADQDDLSANSLVNPNQERTPRARPDFGRYFGSQREIRCRTSREGETELTYESSTNFSAPSIVPTTGLADSMSAAGPVGSRAPGDSMSAPGPVGTRPRNHEQSSLFSNRLSEPPAYNTHGFRDSILVQPEPVIEESSRGSFRPAMRGKESSSRRASVLADHGNISQGRQQPFIGHAEPREIANPAASANFAPSSPYTSTQSAAYPAYSAHPPQSARPLPTSTPKLAKPLPSAPCTSTESAADLAYSAHPPLSQSTRPPPTSTPKLAKPMHPVANSSTQFGDSYNSSTRPAGPRHPAGKPAAPFSSPSSANPAMKQWDESRHGQQPSTSHAFQAHIASFSSHPVTSPLAQQVTPPVGYSASSHERGRWPDSSSPNRWNGQQTPAGHTLQAHPVTGPLAQPATISPFGHSANSREPDSETIRWSDYSSSENYQGSIDLDEIPITFYRSSQDSQSLDRPYPAGFPRMTGPQQDRVMSDFLPRPAEGAEYDSRNSVSPKNQYPSDNRDRNFNRRRDRVDDSARGGSTSNHAGPSRKPQDNGYKKNIHKHQDYDNASRRWDD